MQIDTRHAVTEMLIRYDALQKRMVFLDAFAEGLETFKIHTAIKHFTALFEQMFLAPSSCTSSDVLSIMGLPKRTLNDKQQLVWTFLQSAINQLDEEGVYRISELVYNRLVLI